MDLVFLGLSITSSWGNGHATTYRGLVRGLAELGHRVLFLEREQPWYAANRDLSDPPWCRLGLYSDLNELRDRYLSEIVRADLVLVGSYVPEGVEAGELALEHASGPVVFYDIDTPVTISKLRSGDFEYLAPQLIPRYHLYLSFTGGPFLCRIEREYGARRAFPLYCSVDPDLYYPDGNEPVFDLGYMGTYSDDRQPGLEELLLKPAKKWSDGRFSVAGPLYPGDIDWPSNVHRVEHLSPAEHRSFYTGQLFTLNLTRRHMVRAGHSPSVRLFEAAACGTPVISDYWPGIEEFFLPGEEILISRSAEETLACLRRLPDRRRRGIGNRARERVLEHHTAAARAAQFEAYAETAIRRCTRPVFPAAGNTGGPQ
jgi:spore maturation protein CgeB